MRNGCTSTPQLVTPGAEAPRPTLLFKMAAASVQRRCAWRCDLVHEQHTCSCARPLPADEISIKQPRPPPVWESVDAGARPHLSPFFDQRIKLPLLSNQTQSRSIRVTLGRRTLHGHRLGTAGNGICKECGLGGVRETLGNTWRSQSTLCPIVSAWPGKYLFTKHLLFHLHVNCLPPLLNLTPLPTTSSSVFSCRWYSR